MNMGYADFGEEERYESIFQCRLNSWKGFIQNPGDKSMNEAIFRYERDVPIEKERNVNKWFGDPIKGLDRFVRVDSSRISKILIDTYRLN